MTPLPPGTVLPSPSCAACGHDLTGAIDSARCPECGRPLVEVLVRAPARHGARVIGGVVQRPARRYQSQRRVFGLPLVAIALGHDENGRMGHAKGYIAIGDIATGVIALGGIARGGIALGGIALGGVTLGGLSIGTLAAFGGGALALVGSAVGGFAVGLVANGGGAIGVLAQGGFAAGWLARGGSAHGTHVWQLGRTPDDETRALFDSFAWLLGSGAQGPALHYGLAWTAAVAVVVVTLALLPVLAALARRDRIADEIARRGEAAR